MPSQLPAIIIQSFSQACRLSATLPLLCLLCLPSLFFSLLFFSFISLFLLLPVACVLTSTFLLSAIISPVSWIWPSKLSAAIEALGSYMAASNESNGVNSTAEDVPDCIELDPSEIPPFDNSEEEEEGSSETEEKEVGEIREDILAPQRTSDAVNPTFYEVLSFWKLKERSDS